MAQSRPLDGIKVLEMQGLAPSPFCGMILADFGAEVVVVERVTKDMVQIPDRMKKNPFYRGKRIIRIDLKDRKGKEILKKMIKISDVLIEPYRPGVMERMGFGPDEVFKINPKIVYARLTGWGQDGPYSRRAGHDINYIALSGALSLFKRKGEKPLPPCNLLGDFAGGGMLCALGIMMALFERTRSGKGQIVDSAMLDGAAYLSSMFFGLFYNGLMSRDIGTNRLDGGAPYYQVYESKDGKYVAVGAIESKFYSELLKGLDLRSQDLPLQEDTSSWEEMKQRFQEIFRKRSRDEWEEVFKGRDACVSPILDIWEVKDHPQNRERKLVYEEEGIIQPSPAPRLSRTPANPGKIPNMDHTHTKEILASLGYGKEQIEKLFKDGVVE